MKRAHRIIIRALHERFSRLVIVSIYFRTVVRYVVYAAGGEVHPAVGYAAENDFVWDI